MRHRHRRPHPLRGHAIKSVAFPASPCATAVPSVPPSVPPVATHSRRIHPVPSIRDKAEGNLAVTPGFAAWSTSLHSVLRAQRTLGFEYPRLLQLLPQLTRIKQAP